MTTPEKGKTERDDIKTSVKAAAILGAVFTVAAFGTHDAKTAFSVAVGAAIQANALSGAEKRRSALPPPPKPVARVRLSSRPGARASQPSIPPQSGEPPTAAADTAS